MLAAATNLTTFDIRYHEGRKICITVKCASSESKLGEVIITDSDTKEEFKQETTKTKEFPEQDEDYQFRATAGLFF